MIQPIQTSNLQLKSLSSAEYSQENSTGTTFTPSYHPNKLLLGEESFQQSERNDYSKIVKNKNKPYYKPGISINTSVLDSNYCNRKSTPGSQKSIPETDSQNNDKNIPTQKVGGKKSFNFDDQIFSVQKAPQSPQRTILFSEFLCNKLGEEKFLKMKALLQSSPNPMKVLDENQD